MTTNKDELIQDMESLCKKYAKRYGNTGHKIDRLRLRIIRSYLDDAENRILDYVTDYQADYHESKQNSN